MISIETLTTLYTRSKLKMFCYDIAAEKFVFLNPAFTEFFGHNIQKSSPYSLLEMVHPDDRQLVKNGIQECLQNNQIEDIECRIIRNGHERWLMVDAYLNKPANGSMSIIGHAEDITLFKQHSYALNKHNTKKNAVLNILSHDLAGPIGLIGNLTELLVKETHPLNNPKIDHTLKIVSNVTKRAITLIRNFINTEFIESEAVQLLKRRVELLTKISEATIDYFQMEQDLNLKFAIKANKDAIYVDIDEDKFMQVIHNLISNSMKFTPDGGEISISIEEHDSTVILKVSDNGIGIPEKYHQTLFDKFTNARREGLKGQPSTGLGMSIIKTIVEWHQGKIWFESEVDRGTTFYIELPKQPSMSLQETI